MRRLSSALAPLALAACAGADAGPETAAMDHVPAATPIGEARSCVPITQIRESRVRSDQVIDFVMRGGEAYRVTLPRRCPQLGFEQRFAYATSLSQLCRQDIITVLYQAPNLQRGASCGLAPFQPVRLAERR